MYRKQLYILRHGQTDHNRYGIVQGSGVDSSLNATGMMQARAFYERYRDQQFDLLMCSDLQRTYQTIKPFIDHGIPFERYPEINEINWGEHEGKKSDPVLIENYKQVVEAWENGHFDVSVPKGESASMLANRIRSFLDVLAARQEEKILICSHGRTLRCMLCLIKGEPISNMSLYEHENTGLNIVEYDGLKYEVHIHNDTSHLQEIKMTD